MKAKYLKESAKHYFKGMAEGMLSSLKWLVPASAGIIVLGAIALEAADNEEETPDEESTKEEASSVDEADEGENLETVEKQYLEEE